MVRNRSSKRRRDLQQYGDSQALRARKELGFNAFDDVMFGGGQAFCPAIFPVFHHGPNDGAGIAAVDYCGRVVVVESG